MNESILKLRKVLKNAFPHETTCIQVHVWNHFNGSEELEFWVHTPGNSQVFIDTKDMYDYVMSFEKLTVDKVLQEWGM